MHLDQLEAVDIKYENGFFAFQLENTQIKHFCPKGNYYLFSHIEKFEGTDFENRYSFFFQIPAKNTQIQFFFKFYLV